MYEERESIKAALVRIDRQTTIIVIENDSFPIYLSICEWN